MIHRGDSESVLFDTVSIYRDRCPDLVRTRNGVARRSFIIRGNFGSEGRFGSPSRARGPFPLPLFIVTLVVDVFAVVAVTALARGKIITWIGRPFAIGLFIVLVPIIFLFIGVGKCGCPIRMLLF